MGLIGKFISNAWNGIKEKIGSAGKMIKEGINATWNKGKEMVGAAGQWIADNQDTIGKIVGTALGAGLNLYTGGAAAPWIAGANNLIQNLPDNILTRQLKNMAKGAVFDYRQGEPEKKPEQSNGLTEYQVPRISSFAFPSSPVSSSNIIRRPVKQKPPKIIKSKIIKNKVIQNKMTKVKTGKGKKTKGKKTKGKK